jgi:hypothetical protein
METKSITDKKYYELFPLTKRREALRAALKVRRFEIEMYWKRATYFWAFIATAFAGYFAVLASYRIDSYRPVTVLISFIGFIFSLGWHFVNRGSKYWQENWEEHVFRLEQSVQGPLFACLKIPRNKCLRITGSFPYSGTKINQILSFVTAVCWGVLFVCSVLYTFYKTEADVCKSLSNYASGCCLVVISGLLLWGAGCLLSKYSRSDFYKECPTDSEAVFFRNRVMEDPTRETIKMGNDEFILYIRKRYPRCSLATNELGRMIWSWIQSADSDAKKVETDRPCYWQTTPGSTHVSDKELPKTATQFEFDRRILLSLYAFLDRIGSSEA